MMHVHGFVNPINQSIMCKVLMDRLMAYLLIWQHLKFGPDIVRIKESILTLEATFECVCMYVCMSLESCMHRVEQVWQFSCIYPNVLSQMCATYEYITIYVLILLISWYLPYHIWTFGMVFVHLIFFAYAYESYNISNLKRELLNETISWYVHNRVTSICDFRDNENFQFKERILNETISWYVHYTNMWFQS